MTLKEVVGQQQQQKQQQFICTVLYKKNLQVELNEYIATGHPK